MDGEKNCSLAKYVLTGFSKINTHKKKQDIELIN